jgi:hypothetical protein
MASPNKQVNATAQSLGDWVPSALRAPAARYLGRYTPRATSPVKLGKQEHDA